MARVALVTGGTRGIGAAISRALKAAGYTVAANYAGNDEAAAAFKAETGIPVYKWSVADYDACVAGIASVEADLGPVEVLVNNAGWDRFMNFIDSEPELWDKILGINLTGPRNMTHVVVRGMAERGCGRVVTIASDAGRVGSSGEAVYSACKGGMIALSKTVARELATTGVTLNVVCPGPTDTPILRAFTGEGERGQKVHDALKRAIPMKRLGEPEDIAGMAVYLASRAGAWTTGQTFVVDGGVTTVGG